MGTKIQCKTVLPTFYSVKDLNGNVSNGMCLLSHDERAPKIGQHYNSFLPRLPINGYLEYEKEKVRQTILKHESTFRHQLQELHRLYSRQRELMNNLKMRELHKNETMHLSRCLSHTPPDEVKRTWDVPRRLDSLKRKNCLADLNEPILIEDTPIFSSDANPHRNIFLIDDGIRKMKKFPENHFMERNRPERLAIDINADAQSDDLPTNFPNHAKAELKKKTIFGVVISDDDREPFFTASSGNINSLKQSLDSNGGKIHMNGNISSVSSSKEMASSYRYGQECSSLRFDSINGTSPSDLAPKGNQIASKFPMVHQQNTVSHWQTKQENSKGSSLPWFIAKSQQIGRGENCYHMNLDLLQNCSQQFFKKSETDESFSRVLNQKQEDKKTDVSDAPNIKKIFGVPIFKSSGNPTTADSISRESFTDVNGDDSGKVFPIEKGLANNSSGLRNQIDLNMSLDEEEAPLPPCLLPQVVVKIATTEIDLEAPAVLESEENTSLEEEELSSTELAVEKKPMQPHEQVMKQAAEAMVSISSSNDCLKWFADLICSQDNECNFMETSSRKGGPHEGSITKGMDNFEYMTLGLRDMNEEGNYYEPSILDIECHEEEKGPKRPRRGQPRRGRQRRDFQRDVLPSLVSLSRHEVSEDILTFEELLKTTGSSWQLRMSQRKAGKNGRGRPRSLAHIVEAPPITHPLCTESKPEKTSLKGWGKRTRRLPRQRCPNSNLSPMKQW